MGATKRLFNNRRNWTRAERAKARRIREHRVRRKQVAEQLQNRETNSVSYRREGLHVAIVDRITTYPLGNTLTRPFKTRRYTHFHHTSLLYIFSFRTYPNMVPVPTSSSSSPLKLFCFAIPLSRGRELRRTFVPELSLSSNRRRRSRWIVNSPSSFLLSF